MAGGDLNKDDNPRRHPAERYSEVIEKTRQDIKTGLVCVFSFVVTIIVLHNTFNSSRPLVRGLFGAGILVACAIYWMIDGASAVNRPEVHPPYFTSRHQACLRSLPPPTPMLQTHGTRLPPFAGMPIPFPH
jgi:hypothetical protein